MSTYPADMSDKPSCTVPTARKERCKHIAQYVVLQHGYVGDRIAIGENVHNACATHKKRAEQLLNERD